MRLLAEKVKEAILHADKDVRTAAVFYFSDAFSTDPTIMPVVIQAVERYGWGNAFKSYTFLVRLVQTDESIRWLIDQLKPSGRKTTDDEFQLVVRCWVALRRAEPAVLKPHEAEIMKLEALDESYKAQVGERIRLMSRPPDELWADLQEFCNDHDYGTISDDDFDHGCRLVEALGQHKDQFAEKALAVVRGDTGHLENWMEGFAMLLAGDWRLEAAVPDLMKAVDIEDDWIFEESQHALVKIGTEAVVRQFAKEWPTASWTFRMAAAFMLEYIHSDLSVQTALDLLAVEKDQFMHGLLLRSVLMNFATEGIGPTRQYILNTPLDPDVLEVRTALLVACKVLGEQFPEFDAWLEDSKHDQEFRVRWQKKHSGEEEDDVEDSEPPVTFVRTQPRVGRNDPCPCGSGRKYKHCCGRSGAVEETDLSHASAMSDVRRPDSPPTYPLGTVALYGPDDKRTTKIVAGAIKREGAEPVIERWMGTNVKDNPKVQRQIRDFFQRHRVRSVVATDRNIGCPHEEGKDFEVGGDCPFCPFWKGKQGSGARE
jgi:HEAT repeat protein